MHETKGRAGRPAGEISSVLMRQYAQAAGNDGQGYATWRQAAEAGCVGYRAAQLTTKNLVKLGKLEPVADVPVPGSNKPMKGYRPKGWSAPRGYGVADAMRAWGQAAA